MENRRKIFEHFEEQKEYWQERAKNGIEENRKGFCKITLKDSEGNAVPNAKISVEQKSHEFKFGANLFMLDELETKEKNDKYKKAFADVFNMATLPFYWDATEPEKGHTRYAKDSEKIYRRPPIDLCIEFCEKNGIEPREHGLAYESFFPKWLYNATIPEIKSAYENRCREISERYKDKIPTIEVTNEMNWSYEVAKTAFYNDPDFVEHCFKTAEKYFPSSELTINEASPLWITPHSHSTDQYYAYIEANMLKGARIDAIGMQYHMFYRAEDEYRETRLFYNPKNIYRHLDLYGHLNKPIQITEITIPSYSWEKEDEEIQAEIIENLYRIWFSHKNVEQIIYWNLVDGYAHVWSEDGKPNEKIIASSQGNMALGENYYHGGLLRFDMSLKPAYYTIKNLIEKEWHTKETHFTNENGKTAFKGFYGKYDVTIEANGKNVTKEINLYSKGLNEFSFEI